MSLLLSRITHHCRVGWIQWANIDDSRWRECREPNIPGTGDSCTLLSEDRRRKGTGNKEPVTQLLYQRTDSSIKNESVHFRRNSIFRRSQIRSLTTWPLPRAVEFIAHNMSEKNSISIKNLNELNEQRNKWLECQHYIIKITIKCDHIILLKQWATDCNFMPSF